MPQNVQVTEVLTPDDVKFLTELANELKTQNTSGTAKPVIFEVMETKKRIAMDPAYSDGMVLILGEDGTEFYEDDVADAKEFLREYEFDEKDTKGLDAIDALGGLATFCERHIAANRRHYETQMSNKGSEGMLTFCVRYRS